MVTTNDGLESLKTENERLKLERENAQLRSEIGTLGKKWWQSAAIITTMTAIIAAVVPVTAAIQAHYEKERELELATAKQVHEIALEDAKQKHEAELSKQKQEYEIRTGYLERLKSKGEKQRTLRFVLATSDDEKLKTWASAEMAIVEKELSEIDQAIRDATDPKERDRLTQIRETALLAPAKWPVLNDVNSARIIETLERLREPR